MKTVHVVAALIINQDKVFATQRGYGEFKDGWEFPGGKIEPGETPEQAIKREIREELATEIRVEEPLTTVEYDYPTFHLSMQCFICKVERGKLTLLEHEAARWLSCDELDAVDWLPADRVVVEELRKAAMRKRRWQYHLFPHYDSRHVRLYIGAIQGCTSFGEVTSSDNNESSVDISIFTLP